MSELKATLPDSQPGHAAEEGHGLKS
jgi:hypothetical protein